MFVVVNFDALAQTSDIQIERRQVVFLCWMQDLNPGSQTPNRQQTECSLTNRLSYRGSIYTYIWRVIVVRILTHFHRHPGWWQTYTVTWALKWLSSNICHRSHCKDDRIYCELSNYWFLEEHNFISVDQSAYLKRHSAQTSLHHVIDDWLENVNDGAITDACLLDISKCFDSINHTILLNKLEMYGMS